MTFLKINEPTCFTNTVVFISTQLKIQALQMMDKTLKDIKSTLNLKDD